VIRQLEQALSVRPVKRVTDTQRTIAAVLIPLYVKNGQYFLVFMQRTDRVKDHKSQISFPGGARDVTDPSLTDTALREAEEEIGLKRNDVRVLGQLDDMATAGTHYVISPIVGVFPHPYELKVDNFETDEIIHVPLLHLLDKRRLREGTALVDGKAIDSYFYHCDNNKVIWGATARILKQFLGIVEGLAEQGVPLEAD
jgi:8-oxo-dGTP pyrophosphatase MutT (NUDIX family)